MSTNEGDLEAHFLQIAQDRCREILDRLENVSVGKTMASANATCPSCGYWSALSVSYNSYGVGLRCHGQDPCDYADILDELDFPRNFIVVRPRRSAGSVEVFTHEDLNALYPEGFRPGLLIPELVDITGSINAALILSQLMFLSGIPGGRDFGGFHWIFKRHDEWWDEVRIKESSAARAISRLHGLGLIAVVPKIVGSFKKTNHYRVVGEAVICAIVNLRMQEDLP